MFAIGVSTFYSFPQLKTVALLSQKRQQMKGAGMDPEVEAYGALIVDWDGSMVDSQGLNYRSLATVLSRRHGITLRREWYQQRVGTSGDELLAELGLESAHHRPVLTDWGELIIQEAATLRPFPVVLGWVERARAAGVPRAIASGGGAAVVRVGLAATGLVVLFNEVVTREAVLRGKPAPDLFLAASDRLGVAPERCLVIEDADEGLAAAAAAGMAAVDVRSFVVSEFMS
ncbi:HAD family hydrolase [Streptomyces hainanensis]|uniref:HAD family phosphatase n=1 Tax=Streptomyces hainanensis TaxID=402648 RepID=A0A4R4TIL5_9ACTN|nr:HAD family phosphatase [Streptomyces hainanensis]TDC77507.1 HAD family phosphatase [Streptomyces hainanensis]